MQFFSVVEQILIHKFYLNGLGGHRIFVGSGGFNIVQFSRNWASGVVVIDSWLTICAVQTEVCSQYELGFLWDRASIQAQELCQFAESKKPDFPNDLSGLTGFQNCGYFCRGAGRGDSGEFGNL